MDNAIGGRAVPASWNDHTRKVLLECVRKYKNLGEISESHIRLATWNAIKKDFASLTKLDYDKGQLQNQLSMLKKKFLSFHAIATMNGFHWDSSTNKIEASNETWEQTENIQPHIQDFRSKTFQFYDILHEILEMNECPQYCASSSDINENENENEHEQIETPRGLNGTNPNNDEIYSHPSTSPSNSSILEPISAKKRKSTSTDNIVIENYKQSSKSNKILLLEKGLGIISNKIYDGEKLDPNDEMKIEIALSQSSEETLLLFVHFNSTKRRIYIDNLLQETKSNQVS